MSDVMESALGEAVPHPPLDNKCIRIEYICQPEIRKFHPVGPVSRPPGDPRNSNGPSAVV